MRYMPNITSADVIFIGYLKFVTCEYSWRAASATLQVHMFTVQLAIKFYRLIYTEKCEAVTIVVIRTHVVENT